MAECVQVPTGLRPTVCTIHGFVREDLSTMEAGKMEEEVALLHYCPAVAADAESRAINQIWQFLNKLILIATWIKTLLI